MSPIGMQRAGGGGGGELLCYLSGLPRPGARARGSDWGGGLCPTGEFFKNLGYMTSEAYISNVYFCGMVSSGWI
jgi:hypothetical protein